MTHVSYTPITKEEVLNLLPTVIADLKHNPTVKSRKVNNTNIRASMHSYIVRGMFADTRFKHIESVGNQQGLFIKGYVRDIWQYLDEAYALIHSINFEKYKNMNEHDIRMELYFDEAALNFAKQVDKDILAEIISKAKGE